MHDIWHDVDVALATTAAAVLTERLFHGELNQQVFQVVHGVGVIGIADPSAFLQVCIVPSHAQTQM